MWAEHLAPLPDAGFRAVAIDLPGFGEAPTATVEQAPWTDVLATMDALKIDRVAVVGNSSAGAVALRVAVVAPDRVSALALGQRLEGVAALRMPVLAATGRRDKRGFDVAATALVELIPGASRAVIDGAGHLAPLETPEEFRELLLDYLRSPIPTPGLPRRVVD